MGLQKKRITVSTWRGILVAITLAIVMHSTYNSGHRVSQMSSAETPSKLEDVEEPQKEIEEKLKHLIQATERLEEREKRLLEREAALNASSILAPKTNHAGTAPLSPSLTEEESTTAPSVAEENSTASESKLKVMIQLKYARPDRLGSFIRRYLSLWGYAHCHGYEFCIKPGSESHAKYFGFPTCPFNLAEEYTTRGALTFKEGQINQSGVYWMERNDKELAWWDRQHQACAYDETLRAKWGDMVVNASYYDKLKNQTLAQQELFSNTTDPKTITVAVNVRRGDFVDWGRKLIHDEYYVMLIRRLRTMLTKSGKIPQVHLFSEDYGLVDKERKITRNWGMYKGLVDQFHLAPDMRQLDNNKGAHVMDMALNLRDWRHFVKADILVVGGSFSRLPGIGRPQQPDPETGLPLTIYPCTKDCGNQTSYQYAWTNHPYGLMPDKLYLLNLPPALAQYDDPTQDFASDLLLQWNETHNRKKIALKTRKET